MVGLLAELHIQDHVRYEFGWDLPNAGILAESTDKAYVQVAVAEALRLDFLFRTPLNPFLEVR